MVGDWFSQEDIGAWEQRYRASLINSVTGYKPANLIGTRDRLSVHNLAIMSSVVHLGTSPPLIGLIIRPDSAERHTLRNIREYGVYTINHVTLSSYRAAHQTAARYDDDVSEFEAVGLVPEYRDGFGAPFVASSPVKFGLSLVEEIPIQWNGTHFMIGKIETLFIEQGLVSATGDLDLVQANVAALSGLDRYYRTELIDQLPYAKPDSK
jgi:flavin reductase (DIM6/NTAB) family NADH-FMN oxidoreductase RutF